ncbi:hypothetical protein F7Q99_36785 [Streptomyces kaniharaensis]|uniref:Uncharacterized protein n=1 Tax=Streptomyces kaniharaensis TaxID=212423 RepID=A0A6N7L4L8_9ACTN|nr:hypothetical protein [Streptomyces kaniharaensis]MQS17598.1 hypothetical protein [Streptomyces kaniharaensis]
MGWRDAAQASLRALENRDGRHPDPYLELLRLGVQHTEESVVVTLFLPGATVTGTVITLDEWELRTLRELKERSSGVRRVAGEAMQALDDRAQEQRTARPDTDSPFVHLRDVTYRSGCDQFSVRTWRGPAAGISGWTVGEPTPA